MRLACLLVALSACGGPAAKPDAAIDAPPDMVDADTGITGTWIDTYYVTAGATMQSACTSSPQAIVVDPNTAQFTQYSGACHADGTFRLDTPALTSFYLKAGGEMFLTTAHAGLDLSQDHLGRPDVTTAVNVDLAIDLSNMVAWATGDVLVAFSANTGFAESLVFSANQPATNDTTVNASAPWVGYSVDASKADSLQILQLVAHQTTGGLGYLSLDRAYTISTLTMAPNTTAHVPATSSDAFTSPASATSFLAVDAASFDTFASVATPNTTSRTIAADIHASPTPDTLPSPPMISFKQDSTSLTTLNFGNVRYGDPYPASWQRRVHVVESFATSYSSGGAIGSLSALVQSSAPISAAQTGTLAAPIGPPTSVKIDGFPAATAGTVSQTPLVEWSPPSVGVPTDYEVTVYEAHVNATLLSFAPVLHLVISDATSVRIPTGYMLGQRQYVIAVTSRVRIGIDATHVPFHDGMRSASADTLSSLVDTSF